MRPSAGGDTAAAASGRRERFRQRIAPLAGPDHDGVVALRRYHRPSSPQRSARASRPRDAEYVSAHWLTSA